MNTVMDTVSDGLTVSMVIVSAVELTLLTRPLVENVRKVCGPSVSGSEVTVQLPAVTGAVSAVGVPSTISVTLVAPVAVPVKLGAGGIEQIVELDLSDDEREALNASADAVRDVVGVLGSSS